MKSIPLTIPIFLMFSALVSGYKLDTETRGEAFYRDYEWQDFADPTNGRVNYVDKETSRKANLTYASSNGFILRADHTTVLDPSGPGRNSVRIRSLKTYTQHVAIFNVRHMPQGCGTWPAIWETKESNYPDGGEIDIVEGANDESPNYSTLHTTAGCGMPVNLKQTGTSENKDCNLDEGGCSVGFPTSNSFGPSFNKVGGGWYVMERSSTYIKIWFWPRDATNVPAEVKNRASTVNPGGWGVPAAYYPNTKCDFDDKLQEHNIIINLTFCGDWAGDTFEQSGCPSTCTDYVNENPSAYKGAYFDIDYVRTYTK